MYNLTIPKIETFNGEYFVPGSLLLNLCFVQTTSGGDTRFIVSSSQDGLQRHFAFSYIGGYKNVTSYNSMEQRPAL